MLKCQHWVQRRNKRMQWVRICKYTCGEDWVLKSIGPYWHTEHCHMSNPAALGSGLWVLMQNDVAKKRHCYRILEEWRRRSCFFREHPFKCLHSSQSNIWLDQFHFRCSWTHRELPVHELGSPTESATMASYSFSPLCLQNQAAGSLQIKDS